MLNLAYNSYMLRDIIPSLGNGGLYKTDILVRFPNGLHTIVIVERNDVNTTKSSVSQFNTNTGAAYNGSYDLTFKEALVEAERRAKPFMGTAIRDFHTSRKVSYDINIP